MHKKFTLTKVGFLCKSMLVAASLLFTMAQSSNAQCASNATSTADEDILRVQFGTLNNTTTCSTTGTGPTSILNRYSDFTTGAGAPAAPTVQQGQTVAIQVQVGTCGGNYNNVTAAFIDYNHDGTFAANERVYASSTFVQGPHLESGTVTVPFSALTGNAVLRVITVETTVVPATGCGTYTWGETEDYNVNISLAPPCSGTPAPGNTISSATTACSGATVNLSLQNFTTGSGITYQWQSSPTGAAGSYTNIAGATSALYTATISAPTYFQAVVTCGGTASGTSTPVMVALTPFTSCYCASNATSTADEEILNVTVSNLNNSSTCSTLAPGPGSIVNEYSNYTSGTAAPTPAALFLSTTMPMTVQIGTCGGNYGNGTSVFIDWNQNGNFNDAGENVYFGSGTGPHTESFNISVPATAVQGTTRMRIINVENGTAASILPCGTYTWGETEDYLVTVGPCVVSTVTTAPPATTTATCGGNATITASISGSVPSYQWQVQTAANGVWVNLTNTPPYSNVTTNTLTITGVTTAMNGYNYRLVYSNGCTGTSFTTVSTLVVNAIAATFTQAPTALCAGGSTAQLITVTGGGTGVFTPNGAGSGLFTDAAHLIAYTGTAVTSVYAFPTAAGQYSATYTLVRTNGTCVSTPATVTVIANLPLSGPATIPAATAICANSTGTITATGITGGGLTYQWQVSTLAVPAFTNLTNTAPYSGVTTTSLVITNPTAALTGNKYQLVVTSPSCAGSTITSNVTTLTVNPVPVVTIASAPGTSVSPTPAGAVTLAAVVSSATAPIQYQWFRNNVAIAGATAATYVANLAGTYSVSVTDANGCATATSTPFSITLTTTPSDILFIYPSPNNGSFVVRYYNPAATATITEYATVNVYDAKGSRVYTRRFPLNSAYTAMRVVMEAHGKGIYRVDLVNNNGDRLQTGSVMIF